MFAFLQFVAIFSNTATKFQNISNFVANLVAVLENIATKIAKNLTFGCNIEKYCNRGGATEGHGACYIEPYMKD